MTDLSRLFARLPPKPHRIPPAFEAKLEMYGPAACVMLAHDNAVSQIVCLGMVDTSITARTRLDQIDHVADRAHPLLRQFADEQGELFFRGKPADPARLVGELWLAHRGAAASWIPFDRYLARGRVLADTLALGFGSLAEGPTFLLAAYADVLTQHGVTADLGGARQDGARRPVPDQALVFDDGHIVALEYQPS